MQNIAINECKVKQQNKTDSPPNPNNLWALLQEYSTFAQKFREVLKSLVYSPIECFRSYFFRLLVVWNIKQLNWFHDLLSGPDFYMFLVLLNHIFMVWKDSGVYNPSFYRWRNWSILRGNYLSKSRKAIGKKAWRVLVVEGNSTKGVWLDGTILCFISILGVYESVFW